MRIAIFGYGKMGKEVESAAIQLRHTISHIIDISNTDDISKINTSNTDVVIEFTRPDSVVKNIYSCFKSGLPIVTGTTGWYGIIEEIKTECSKNNGALFYSPNFSIGVNLFIEFSKQLAKKLNKFNEYEARIEETHHTQKLDTPSGTAILIANSVLPELTKLRNWNKSEIAEQNELPVTSYRVENVIGNHKLIFESAQDTIELHHNAKSRKGFAIGAILAAEYILNRKGIFTMSDLINN